MACVSELQRGVVPRPGRQRKAQLLYHKRVFLRFLFCQPANIIAWLITLERQRSQLQVSLISKCKGAAGARAPEERAIHDCVVCRVRCIVPTQTDKAPPYRPHPPAALRRHHLCVIAVSFSAAELLCCNCSVPHACDVHDGACSQKPSFMEACGVCAKNCDQNRTGGITWFSQHALAWPACCCKPTLELLSFQTRMHLFPAVLLSGSLPGPLVESLSCKGAETTAARPSSLVIHGLPPLAVAQTLAPPQNGPVPLACAA